ncbi:FAD-binding domain-containing protein [Sistotremastrum niveocremeum HHB9708]|uniref:FAD-binding domain-containing protein n=1 Tax=Sistotremastrum niveocremeum HHB9708 TaxID=1314777 RepID=A0A164U5N3_9AGAM|nr:FAD-binding domain-containing protein [Sistotremastrum niveocremeum HHB9708]
MLTILRQNIWRVAKRDFSRAWAHTSSVHSVNEQDVEHFTKILSSPSSVISTLSPSFSSSSDLENFNADWMGKYKGHATTVLKPRTTEEVSKILKYCWERQIHVVPQGGNTGLVGGSVPIQDELVISLSNLSKVRSFDPVSGILVADAGCVLESLSEHIAPHGFIMPLDLGAKGSCQIGGNVATNAGGLRLLRYGSLHGTVLGLEVVLPDGTVLDQLSTMRKDNTGYDLKQLFIGSEGTIGIITGVSILTPPAPKSTNNVVLALPSFSNVIPVFKATRQHLSEVLSAFEYFDRTAYDLALKHGHAAPFPAEEVEGAECYVLLETSGGKKEHDDEKINTLLETLLSDEDSLILTGTLSQSPSQFASLWAIREGLTEAVSKEGKAYKYDISVPVSSFAEVVGTVRARCEEKGLISRGLVKHVIGYGHVGDGNLHLNVIASEYNDEVAQTLEPFVYEVVASHRGSISAEHGIGVMKTHALKYSKDAISRQWMRKIKDIFDSKGIMNPGKVLE